MREWQHRKRKREVELSTDVEGERALCGSFDEEEQLVYDELMREQNSMEDGEISGEETQSEEENDPEVEDCLKAGNLDKLKRILKKREEECKKLKKEMEKEKLKEKQNKEMKAVLEQINKVNKTRRSLQQSISASRHASPADSPKTFKKVVPTGKVTKQKVSKKPARGTKEGAATTDRSEYNQILESFLKLQHGNTEYADRVANALEATDQIIALSGSKVEIDSDFNEINQTKTQSKNKNKGSKPNEKEVISLKKANERNSNEVFDIIDKFANKQSNKSERASAQVAQALLSALNKQHNSDPESESEAFTPEAAVSTNSKETQDKTIKVLETITQCFHGNKGNSKPEQKNENSTQETSGRTQDNKDSTNKKLISGKCTRPDESDIKQVVKYPHEKLDPRHVTDRDFDKLEFNILIAGELELIALHSMSEQERSARIDVAKVLCYHKKYLDDRSLREGYDSIMKQVEQGNIQWAHNLGEKLHQHLDYRANVILRDRMNNEGFTKVENRKQQDKRGPTGGETTVKDRVFYCLDYNLGTCPQSDHHEGRIGTKKVTKFHFCKRCHKDNEYKSHRDTDTSCPKRKL